MADTKPCSKCQKTLDTAGYPRWCKACRASYKSEYQDLREQMTETRGYSAGVSAMRDYLVAQFEKYGPLQTWNGQSIARIIRECTGPTAPTA
jgi:predicted amidophosphoribosyltransferase